MYLKVKTTLRLDVKEQMGQQSGTMPKFIQPTIPNQTVTDGDTVIFTVELIEGTCQSLHACFLTTDLLFCM